MTVTNGQPAEQATVEADDKTLNCQVAKIYHDAGIRSGDEGLRAVAERWPDIFAGVQDALRNVEAELEAAG